MPPNAQTTPTGLPVVDISATGPGRAPLQQVMGLMREHGPLLVRRLHGRDVTFVADLDLVTELADETRFTKAIGPALENVREFAADGLFTAYNDEPNWAKAHDILMPAFAMGSMRTYHPVMLRVARRLIDSWDRAARTGQPVDIADDMTRMTLDTIGLTGFGYDFGSFERDEPHPFVESMVRCLEWAMTRLARTPGGDHTAADEAFRADADYLAQVVDDVISARSASGRGGFEDLLGLMLTATHPGDGTTLDTTNIRNQVITFLIAGHETTSGAMSFAMYYLAKHPAVLDLVRREVDALWGDTADPEPTFDEVGRLTCTRQVLNEALRLWPTAAAFEAGRPARTPCSAAVSRCAPDRSSPSSRRCCTGSPCGGTTPSCSTPPGSRPRRRPPAPRTPSSPSAPVNAPASDGSSPSTRPPCCWRSSSTGTACTTTPTTA